ncbi:hypothetical protein F7725_001884 [Dissostichus mawsoni]|uniref:AMP-binding enzyme C-terminal domain-containing protein n=1 Tax=Dissostichus mawsoni TaxID=36200 RepID=A0A7J5Y0V7_DISMA|nr:hypothetical protein F7725_001884 [Dissostichus mawsoni]
MERNPKRNEINTNLMQVSNIDLPHYHIDFVKIHFTVCCFFSLCDHPLRNRLLPACCNKVIIFTYYFNTKLSFGDTQTVWARTGYLGFLRRTELTDASGGEDNKRSLRKSVEDNLMKLSAVFTWTNLLVVVVELEGSEQEALDLVALVTNVVLEEHYLIVGVVVVVDPGVIPINSRGEKQRMHLRDGFLADQLDPIYVAYNM